MKYCTKCGAELADDAKFCTVCGMAFEDVAPQAEETPVVEVQAPETEAVPFVEEVSQVAPAASQAPVVNSALAGQILKFGILGIAFSSVVSILGIIFGAIARKKGKQYLLETGTERLSGKAKAGYILGKAGVIVGIIATVVWFIYFVIMLAAGMSYMY